MKQPGRTTGLPAAIRGCASWQEIQAKWQNLSEKEKGYLFEELVKTFRKYGKLETFHVSGKTPTGTRARIIGEFARAERALITNARCLTEGVDVPSIDCVLFADPRRSAVDTALRLERYFGWPAEVWLNLQTHYDQQIAKAEMKSALAGIQPCLAM